MRLYLSAKTKMSDLTIDYIEVQTKAGKNITLTWDESDYGTRDGVFSARYKGVSFDDTYGNGKIADLNGMQITEIGIYNDNDEPVSLEVTNVTIEDGAEILVFDGQLYAVQESFSNSIAASA